MQHSWGIETWVHLSLASGALKELGAQSVELLVIAGENKLSAKQGV